MSADSTGMPETPSASSTARRIELTVAIEINDRFLCGRPFDSGCASARNFILFVRKFRDQNAKSWCCLNIESDEIFIFFRQSPPPPLVYLFFFTVMCSPQPLEIRIQDDLARILQRSTDCTQAGIGLPLARNFPPASGTFRSNSLEPEMNRDRLCRVWLRENRP